MTYSITDLPDLIAGLNPNDQRVFSRIFSVDNVRGALKLPEPMVPWVKRRFGGTDRVTSQQIIKITNLVTLESSVYNPLRAIRPHDFSRLKLRRDTVGKAAKPDHFASPLEGTPEDPFGRVEGKHCITAGNVAKYEQHHGVVIFNNADPWDFGCSEVADYIETGLRWAQRAHDFDPGALYFLFLWNCTNRAGASIPHGHAQVVLARRSHYARIEFLRRSALEYEEKYSAGYFDDLFSIHKVLGLGWEADGIRAMSYLTALKNNEVMILSSTKTGPLGAEVYRVLSCLRDRLGAGSFNLGSAFPPLGEDAGWGDFPVITRIVDRGDSADRSSDIGAMEFYGASVVTSDPWVMAGAVKTELL